MHSTHNEISLNLKKLQYTTVVIVYYTVYYTV